MTDDDLKNYEVFDKFRNIRPKQLHYWVHQLVAVSEDIANSRISGIYTRYFWILLHGVLNEVYRYFKSQSSEIGEIGRLDLAIKEFKSRATLVLARIEELRDAMSDKGMSIVDYERHSSVHTFQNDYVPTVGFFGSELRVIKAKRKEKDYSYVSDILDEKFGKVANVDELALNHYLGIVSPHVEKIASAIDRWIEVVKK